MLPGLVLMIFVLLTSGFVDVSGGTSYADLPDELKTGDQNDKHGGIKMGISSDNCDNGKDSIRVDWNQDKRDYTCYSRTIFHGPQLKIKKTFDKENQPSHVCFPNEIHYEQAIPTSGKHRPLWPKYGEYLYVPPQRWVHSLEHGAAVFLYHPCVDRQQLALFKHIAFNCLKKIIITPYRNVSVDQPFVVVTYQNKLSMNNVQQKAIEKFIQETVWQRSSEKDVWNDGKYSFGLLRSSYENSLLENNYNVICSKHFPDDQY